MNLNQIRKMAYNYKGKSVDYNDKKTINKNVIEILNNCISKNIKLDINENDYIEIVNIYHELYGLVYDDFLKALLKSSNNDISLFNVIEKITK